MTAAVVLRLVEPISGLGHHIYMDNLYTSPALFLRLRSLGFGACGTRHGVPAEAKSRLEKGERCLIPVDEGMNVVQRHDKRVVSVLSTIHDDTPVPVERRSQRAPGGRETVEKPRAVVEYNKYMGGVDRGDQLLTYYGYPHHTRKWCRRAFFFLFDATVVNSYTLYRQSTRR
ncbi:PiggyBac transposable element-derived protein 4, partial [Geodia barretti]